MLLQPIISDPSKFRLAAITSLAQRSGLATSPEIIGADELGGMSLSSLAKESLRVARLPASGNAHEMFSRALSTSDFPYILSNVAEKSLFEGFDSAEESWKDCFETGSVSNFKTHSSVRASELDDLEEIKEHGEYKHGARGRLKRNIES